MLKIVVFCGGTGSVALQQGFATLYDLENIQLDIVVNAYDSGKSTGACRRIFNDCILGPSDLRKNQVLQYSLLNKRQLEEAASKQTQLYSLMNTRLSAQDPETYYKKAESKIKTCKDAVGEEKTNYLLGLLRFFFFQRKSDGSLELRRSVLKENFQDFSLSNIFYSSLAVQNGGSMTAAADAMAAFLNLRSNVHLISDKNLFLNAKTESGHVIRDEGEIVAWGDPADKITEAILLDGEEEYIPFVDEADPHDHCVERLTEEADIIVFSSGTQWSSLIPTYMHRGFRDMIERSKAKKYLIMNNVEDRDARGVDAEQLCAILERYIDFKDITVVLNKCASLSMRYLPEKYHSISAELSWPGDSKHIPEQLVGLIMTDYYREALSCHHQMFDFDGTLWNEKGTSHELEIGRKNLRLFDGIIVTGNSVAHVADILKINARNDRVIDVYADYGNTYFRSSAPENISYLTDEYFLPGGYLDTLNALGRFAGKAKMRGETIITIKPLTDRERVCGQLDELLSLRKHGLMARVAGRTSIDITYERYTKAEMIKLIMNKNGLDEWNVLFVGNELKTGNEETIKKIGVKTLQVDDVYECYTYLRTRELTRAEALSDSTGS